MMRKSPRKTAPIIRFDKYWIPEPNSGCWIWIGGIASNGYGSFYDGERMDSAHAFSYRYHVGPVQAGLDLDHLCRVRCCVNPDHLEPVTRQVNAARGLCGHHMKGKTSCKRGHAFDDVNTYFNSNGTRECRTCQRHKMRRLRAQRKEHGLFACTAV